MSSVTVPDRREAFAQRLYDAASGGLDVATAYLGLRLGLYRALADTGPATSAELAERTGTNERLVREWLEQQAATEVLEAARGPAGEWRFSMPAEHASVLLDPEAMDLMAGTVLALVGDLVMLPRLVEAFRTGRGIPYADYGTDGSVGQGMSSRPIYRAEIPRWFAAMPDLSARLNATGARVLDIGCGHGWSSVNIAKLFPSVRVDGVDLDEASIMAARAIAEQEGVADRVTYEVRDAATMAGAGYDVATMLEMLHDLAHPVEVLRAGREALGPDGVVLVADEITEDEFTGPAGEVDRRHYGWSVLHCLPVSMAESDSAATGTVMRPSTVRAYAEAAGFATVEIVPVESDNFRLYLLRPPAAVTEPA